MGDDVRVNRTDRLRGVAVLLAVLSVLGAGAVAATAGLVQAGQDTDRSGTLSSTGDPTTDPTDDPTDGPTDGDFDYEGWKQVSGVGQGTEAATYKVPGGTAWEPEKATDPVSYRDADERPYVSGHAAAFYYGNACSSDGARFPAAWAVLGDTEPGSDLEAFAEDSARRWARGVGAGENTQAPVELGEPVETELADGTPAVSVEATLDMSVFTGACFEDDAELTLVAFSAGSRIKSLVVARYLGVNGGLGDQQYAAIIGSLDP